MKKQHDTPIRASALRTSVSIALVSISAIFLVDASDKEFQKNEQPLLAPNIPETLGSYPPTSMSLSANTTVTPSAAPTNTNRISVSTSTNFKGTLEGNPTTGVVRITDAHPAGIYVVAVRAFNGGAVNATQTFILHVTTPATCTPLNFAATNFGVGNRPFDAVVGDFNGDGKQDLAAANYDSK
jgi:hypothetical protein